MILCFSVITCLTSCTKSKSESTQGQVDLENIFNHFKRTGDYSIVDLTNDEGVFQTEPILQIGNRKSDENFILGEIKKVIYFEELLYVLDSRQKNIKVFDLNGTWIRTLDINGRGPGESLYPEDLQIDKQERKIVVLDRMGLVLKFDIDNELNFSGQFELEKGVQSFCITDDNYVIQYRISPGQDSANAEAIGIYNSNLELLEVIYNDYSSEHWLIKRQLSRGSIYCSDNNEIYKSELFIPRLIIYDGNNFKEKKKLLFNHLDLTKLIFKSRGDKPVQSFSFDKYNQNIKNVIDNQYFIYLQIERYLPDRTVQIHTYKIEKNTLTANYLGITGLINYIDEERVITSLNDPYPHIVIY